MIEGEIDNMIKRKWLFTIEADAGFGYLLASGELVRWPAKSPVWIGTDVEASAEAERRSNAYEELTGGVITRVVYESQGKEEDRNGQLFQTRRT